MGRFAIDTYLVLQSRDGESKIIRCNGCGVCHNIQFEELKPTSEV